MIKTGEKTFFLSDCGGDDTPFSIRELQSELIYCFLSAGMADSSCFAEDVALAVEYSLQEAENFGGCISVDELTSMVVETLENSGFYPVADCFRKRNGRELEVLFSTSESSLKSLISKHGILLYGVDAQKVISSVSLSFKAMHAEQAPLPLIIEMVRYYYRQAKYSSTAESVKKKHIKCDYLVKFQEFVHEVPDNLKSLIDNGVLKVNDVTVYHPSIRIMLNIKDYAVYKGFAPLLTEMFWQPCGAELGQSMDAAIEILAGKYTESGGTRELPVYLTVNGMDEFAQKFFGTEAKKSRHVADFVIENLSSNMFYSFYKVRF